jgi:Zn-dependent peptidase ImmA (M78 family)
VISAWEAGEQRPTVGALTELARFYDRPLSVFLLERPPDEPDQPPDLRASARRDPGPLGRQSVLAIRRARRFQTILSEIRGPHSWARPRPAEPSLEGAAIAARAQLDVSVDEQASWDGSGRAFARWRQSLEQTGAAVLQSDIPIEEVRAFSIPGDPPVIVINEHDWAASKVFSLFHEYGHVMLGSGGICSPLGTMPGQDAVEAERSSDIFAGAVLVPRASLESEPIVQRLGRRAADIDRGELARLASTYSVSTQVVWYRFRQTGLISERAFHDRWDEWRHPVSKRQSSEAPKIARWQKASWRVGSRLAAELMGAEERGEISIGEALTGLDVKLEDLDKLAAAIR